MILIPGGPIQAILNVVDSSGVRVAAASGPTCTLRRNGSVVPGYSLTVTTIAAGHYVITGTADAGWAHGDQISIDADTGSTGAGEVTSFTVLSPSTAAALATLQISANAIQAKTDNLPASPAAVGSAMTLDASAITAIESALLNEADGQALLAAISLRVQQLFDSGVDVPVTTLVSLVAAQVRSELAIELARLDIAVSTRLASTGYTAPTTPPTVDQIATRLLVTPANKLLTDAGGQVTATNGGGGGGGDGVTTGFSEAALSQLSGIKFIGPLTVTSEPRSIIAGDDYSGTRAIVFESTALPDLSAASSLTFSLRRLNRERTLAITSTAVIYTASPKKLSVTLTAAQTRVEPGWYEFDIEAVVGGLKQTVVGPGVRLQVLDDQTR